MIPKIIHYCWFGGNELPELAQKCINSWKKYCPNYKLIQWNESNFDINCCDYVKEAYHEKMWAFVSDYARFKILYDYGGIYFDTDVELIKTIDDIVENGPFMAVEKGTFLDKRTQAKIESLLSDSMGKDPIYNHPNLKIIKNTKFVTKDDLMAGSMVNPGLGAAARPGMELYKDILGYYEKTHFINSDGKQNQLTVVMFTTEYLRRYGLKQPVKDIQRVADIEIYPSEYFCPMDYETGKIKITENTRSIHHYSETWHSPQEKKWHVLEKKVNNRLGIDRGYRLFNSLPIKFIETIYKTGWKDAIKKVKHYIIDG